MIEIIFILILVKCYRIAKILNRIEKSLHQLISFFAPDETAKSLVFIDTKTGQEIKGFKMFIKADEGAKHLSLKIVDAKGNAAKVDGEPKWALSDETLAGLSVDAGGMGASLQVAGLVGKFMVQVKADADLGEGVKELLGELEVEVIPGEAVSLNISVD